MQELIDKLRMQELIDKLLTDLNDFAQNEDQYDYGLPQYQAAQTGMSEIVREFVANVRALPHENWTKETPKRPGKYLFRRGTSTEYIVRLAFGGYEGDYPLVYLPDHKEPFAQGFFENCAEWGPKLSD